MSQASCRAALCREGLPASPRALGLRPGTLCAALRSPQVSPPLPQGPWGRHPEWQGLQPAWGPGSRRGSGAVSRAEGFALPPFLPLPPHPVQETPEGHPGAVPEPASSPPAPHCPGPPQAPPVWLLGCGLGCWLCTLCPSCGGTAGQAAAVASGLSLGNSKCQEWGQWGRGAPGMSCQTGRPRRAEPEALLGLGLWPRVSGGFSCGEKFGIRVLSKKNFKTERAAPTTGPGQWPVLLAGGREASGPLRDTLRSPRPSSLGAGCPRGLPGAGPWVEPAVRRGGSGRGRLGFLGHRQALEQSCPLRFSRGGERPRPQQGALTDSRALPSTPSSVSSGTLGKA